MFIWLHSLQAGVAHLCFHALRSSSGQNGLRLPHAEACELSRDSLECLPCTKAHIRDIALSFMGRDSSPFLLCPLELFTSSSSATSLSLPPGHWHGTAGFALTFVFIWWYFRHYPICVPFSNWWNCAEFMSMHMDIKHIPK